jgi:hypothetical protein
VNTSNPNKFGIFHENERHSNGYYMLKKGDREIDCQTLPLIIYEELEQTRKEVGTSNNTLPKII